MKKLIGGFILFFLPDKEGANVYGAKKESVMDPLHSDLPLNVFKC